jgi:HEAT repeat protein
MNRILLLVVIFTAVSTRVCIAATSSPATTETCIVVSDVSEEYKYVGKERCGCGGAYEVVSQSTREENGKHFDRLDCRCQKCGKEKTFIFDVTSIFQEYELSGSKEAKKKAYATLDSKYPKPAREHLPIFSEMLKDANPHTRTWAIAAIAGIGTPEAIGTLLDGYLKEGLLRSFDYEEGLKKIGAPILPSLGERLRKADPEQRSTMVSLLGEIQDQKSRELVEKELNGGPEENRRACYLSLGQLGYKESAPILRRFLQGESPNPDDGLLWAMGRCGTKDDIKTLRKYTAAEDTGIRAAALVALGALADVDSAQLLMDIVVKDKDEDIRHSAIYALGLMKCRDAVPLLIACLEKGPEYNGFHGWSGIYNDDESNGAAGLTQVSIRALERIGDVRAKKAFEKVLRDDTYYLDFEDAANAAARLAWKELVPAIIARLDKDYEKDLALYGKDNEQYSPALRKLTGMKYGENPKEWMAWLKNSRDESRSAKGAAE